MVEATEICIFKVFFASDWVACITRMFITILCDSRAQLLIATATTNISPITVFLTLEINKRAVSERRLPGKTVLVCLANDTRVPMYYRT